MEDYEVVIIIVLKGLKGNVRTHGAVARREVLIAYSKHDVLGLMKDNNKILNRILMNAKPKVTEYTARFINALASDYCGRSYLLEAPKTVSILIDLLKSEVGVMLVSERKFIIIRKEIRLSEGTVWARCRNFHCAASRRRS